MAKRRRKSKSSNGQATDTSGQSDGNGEVDRLRFVPLSEETRRRYLNYAMSVISSRALPDVRDGLKPVQRRILYVMFQELRLTADAKYVKASRVIGEVIGKYHPHGDTAIYEALVRLAQNFTYREPLVDGQGNFGSIIGLPAAAQRYTEARLRPIAEQLMNELRFDTVDMRDTYDGTNREPVVLPARFPHLLVNGTTGIAVGMATSIPPHNLNEVIKACLHLIDSDGATVAQLMRFIKGPDFPLGGRIVSDRRELRKMYESGRGSVKVRAEWQLDKQRRKEVPNHIVVNSIPYGVETGPLVASLGEIAESSKLPQLLAVADESDERFGMRIVLELKSGTDPETVMAYLFKHTALEQNFSYNATALVPDEHDVLVPRRCSLDEMLQHFLEFRLATVRRRFEYQLAQLEKRIHILEGFEIIFHGLDKALKLIRSSTGKKDAAEKLMRAFPLDEVQADAILELALYRIGQLQIDMILEELADKRKQALEIHSILKSEKRLWGVVSMELKAIADEFGTKRRTALGSSEEIAEFDPQAYIVRENTNVIVTAEGWVKRLGKISTIDKLRTRDGDEVLAVVPCSTLDTVIFFAGDGTAYTLQADQIPASTGYGEPLAKFVKLSDGAALVAAVGTDSRFTPEDKNHRKYPTPSPYVVVATKLGQVLRMSLSPFREPSTKSGRKYCRLRKGDAVVHAELMDEKDTLFLATRQARIIHFSVSEIPVLAGPGKGVKGISLSRDDEVLGARRLSRPSDSLQAINDNGNELSFGQTKYQVTKRAGRGHEAQKRVGFKTLIRPEIPVPDWDAIG